MICKKCEKEIEDDSVYCRFCGRKQIREKKKRTRANGEGTVWKRGDKYIATATHIYIDAKGNKHRETHSRTFDLKKDAYAALPALTKERGSSGEYRNITFKKLYDKWYPTHRAGDSTMGNYSAAFKYFLPVWNLKMDQICIDDLQECIDNCGQGKRTQQNMKTVCGLVYKHGIPRDAIPNDRNLAQFLKVSGIDPAPRAAFDDIQIRKIKNLIGTTWGAEYVYCLIYLGMRPSEFLDLQIEDYDQEHQAIVGGAKTEAGKGRKITLSPKIKGYMQSIRKRSRGALIHNNKGTPYTLQNFTETVFYPVLDAAGIDNPIIFDIDEKGEKVNFRKKYTPYTCRHTFATLMKRVPGASKDKQELIGHASEKMLRYYQDVSWDDIRAITDAI